MDISWEYLLAVFRATWGSMVYEEASGIGTRIDGCS